MKSFPYLCIGFLSSVYVIRKIYNNRHIILLSLLKKSSIIKTKIDKFTKPKKNYHFNPCKLLITGEHINYENSKVTNLNFHKLIENVSYYTGIINFNLEYSFNNQNYLFIRKKYLIDCLSDLKDFIHKISIKPYKEKKSNVLNAMIAINDEKNIDITKLIYKVEGVTKDFNCDSVYVRDLYPFLKEDYKITINELNEPTIIITIIDTMADEHHFTYQDKLIL